jgi:hypothetical protein
MKNGIDLISTPFYYIYEFGIGWILSAYELQLVAALYASTLAAGT